MNKWACVKAIQAKRLRARERANRRWALDRERRAVLDQLDPIRFGGKIMRRIVVIDRETSVRERTFYEHDRACDWRRKLREVLAFEKAIPEQDAA